MRLGFLILLIAPLSLAQPVKADSNFNPYILDAVEVIAETRAGGGYDINSSLTRNLSYGDSVIKATKPTKTMCVAAVVEVIVEAMRLYEAETGQDAYARIPVTSFTKGTLAGLRANIYMFQGTGSRGTAHTLERFGIGEELSFSNLLPGDFVNFNRNNKSGHAAVFLGYLDGAGNVLNAYGNEVRGFLYFSAQGKGKPDAGFAYRYGFFDGHCPKLSDSKPRDCGIIRSDNKRLLNVGRMHDPNIWRYDEAVAQIREGVRSAFSTSFPEASKGFLDQMTEEALNAELTPTTNAATYFSGYTTD